jgi:hypothetical protein
VSAYRVIWQLLAGAAGVVGGCAALLLMEPGTLASAFVSAALLGALVSAGVLALQDEMTADRLGRRCLAASVLTGAAVLAVSGLGRLAGVAAVLVVLLLLAGAPPVVAWALGMLNRPTATTGPRVSGSWLTGSPRKSGPPPGLAGLTDGELCAAWMESCRGLRDAPLAQALSYVQTRQEYLDELERRDPAGLQAWLASTASAAGDPRPFISSTRNRDRGETG